jgi:hypothetical protein
MRTFLFSLIFTLIASVLHAQDFSKVDAHARSVSIPRQHKNNLDTIASVVTRGMKTDLEKARSLFVWVAHHIEYDIDGLRKGLPEDADVPNVVIQRKKAVCEGYSKLYEALCKSAGIPCIYITGYSKSIKGVISNQGHAWNVVRIGKQWHLLDVTWGAGIIDDDKDYVRKFDDKFFMSDPVQFGLNHYPDDPLMQLSAQPIDFQRFKTGTSSKKMPTADFEHLDDSLSYYHTLDENNRLDNMAQRLNRFDPGSDGAKYYKAKAMVYKSMADSKTVATQLNNKILTQTEIPWLEEKKKELGALQKQNKVSENLFNGISSGRFRDYANQALPLVRSIDKNLENTVQQIDKILTSLKAQASPPKRN